MPAVERVGDAADPRVADYVCLTDVELRTKFEPPNGLFIAEGQLIIQRALRAGYELRSVLVSPRWLGAVAELELPPGIPIYVAEPPVLEAVTGFNVHRGALASVRRPPLPDAGSLLHRARRVVALENVNTHTNVGAIFRSAAALGMDAVLLNPSCADPLYRRAVRVSMGQVFSIPYARIEPWPAALSNVKAAGFDILALTPRADATPIDRVRLRGSDRVVLLLGSEGPGLSSGAEAAADRRVRIPMSAGADSLNVAAAAAVACYVLGRR